MEFLSDPISFIGAWLEGLLLGWGMAPGLVDFLMKLIGAGLLGMIRLLLVVFTIWMERKLYARFQDRLGPNRVGPWGIFQTVPDMIKIFTKEYITPDGADKVVYNLANSGSFGSHFDLGNLALCTYCGWYSGQRRCSLCGCGRCDRHIELDHGWLVIQQDSAPAGAALRARSDEPPINGATHAAVQPAAAPATGGLLTPKDARILSLLAVGRANKEIARAMDLGEQTVKWHLKNVFFKLNAASRKHAVDRARLLGLLEH